MGVQPAEGRIGHGSLFGNLPGRAIGVWGAGKGVLIHALVALQAEPLEVLLLTNLVDMAPFPEWVARMNVYWGTDLDERRLRPLPLPAVPALGRARPRRRAARLTAASAGTPPAPPLASPPANRRASTPPRG